MFREHKIEWTDEKVARLWDYYSRTRNPSELYFSKRHGSEILSLSAIDFAAPLKVLDFGCGPGFILDHIVDKGTKWQYTGLDFSAGSIESLKTRAKDKPNFVDAFHIPSLPSVLEPDSFDLTTILEVVEHLNDEHLSSTVEEIRRLLTKSGRVLITTPNNENLEEQTKLCPDCGCIFHEWQHVRSWTPELLTSYMSSQGFKPIRVQTVVLGSRLRKLSTMARRMLGRLPGPTHIVALYEKT